MNAATRVGVLVAGLVVLCGAAVGVGRATGPVGPIGPADDDRTVLHASDDHDHDHASSGADDDLPGGLATSRDGYTLALDETAYAPGEREVALRILDEDGESLADPADYDVQHDERLHLVAVRRDFTGFQHVHPRLDADGTWRTTLDLAPGSWRVLADLVPAGGDPVVLGADVAVSGATTAPRPAAVSRTATVDGYTVTLDGDLTAGAHSMLDLTVERDGRPVTDLQPYLGAYGHLVALREGDLAYLHVHPEDGPAGPTIAFGAEVPSAGRYHLYLDFRHDGVVRTASFTVEAGRETGEGTDEETDGEADHDHD